MPRVMRFLCLSYFAIAGCSGGGGDTTEPVPEVSLNANGVDVRWLATNANGGHGVAALSGSDIGAAILTQSVGRDPTTTGLTIDDGYLFESAGLAGNTAVETGGGGALSVVALPSSYDQGFLYQGLRDGVGIFIGVYGRDPGAVPATGTVAMTGDAVARYNDVALSGQAAVAADFADGTVDVALSGLTGAQVVPFDTLRVSGAVIDGTRFEGGAMMVSETGIEVTPFGASPRDVNSGVFLGAPGAPTEAGGLVQIAGDGNALVGAYMAD